MITKDAKNIFIVDDSVFFRTKLSDILTAAGHNVRFAQDGREVIDELRINSGLVDLLILDLQIPDINGFGVLHWINDNDRNGKFPVLVVTGVYEPLVVLERLKALGAAGLITKALTPEQILFRVNRLLFHSRHTEGVLRTRVPVSTPADFIVGEITRTGYLLNISETGAFLKTKIELLAGTRLTLRFSLSSIVRVVELKGIVKWSTGEAASNSFFGGVGIMFTPLTPEEQAFLRKFVDSELKRLGLDR